MELDRILQLAGLLSESQLLLEAKEDDINNDKSISLPVWQKYQSEAKRLPEGLGAENLQTSLEVIKWIGLHMVTPATKAKYLKRICQWYAQPNSFSLNQFKAVKEELAYFETHSANLPQNDINNPAYNDFHEFTHILDQFAKTSTAKSSLTRIVNKGGFGAYGQVIINDPHHEGFYAVKLGSKQQSIQFGQTFLRPFDSEGKVKWCTAVDSSDNLFDSYNSGGENDVIVIWAGKSASSNPTSTSVRKFCIIVAKNEFQNEKNENIIKVPGDITYLSQFEGYKDLLNILIKKHYHVDGEEGVRESFGEFSFLSTLDDSITSTVIINESSDLSYEEKLKLVAERIMNEACMGKSKSKAKSKAKKASKDYDGDGKIESGTDEYKGSVDKAIKKAKKEKWVPKWQEDLNKEKAKKKSKK
jgi:hypothetical protein